MADEKKQTSDKNPALFIPAGIFLGMGIGLLIDRLVAGMFIGFGAGFLLFALVSNLKKKG